MDTDTITIPVSPRLAKAYREATPEMRRKWELLLHYQLESILDRPVRGWAEITADLSAEAARNGLTEDILQDILREWEEDRKQRRKSSEASP